ncbi:hypothetical protein [Streptomyces albogriseolus]|uniref:hypothetical protein n=1 Tax=Streptomyces albogriseolus TaxID=1887 RepID=UPI0033A17A10
MSSTTCSYGPPLRHPRTVRCAAAEKYRAWVFVPFTELAAASGYAEPEVLARRLHLPYDGAEQAAQMDGDPSATTTVRAAAAALLDAAPLVEATC